MRGNSQQQQPHYPKWQRNYLDFYSKYKHNLTNRKSFLTFSQKLKEKRQPLQQIK